MTPAELAEKLESFASEQDEKADVETNRAMRVGFGNEAKLLRQAAARLRSMAEALRPFAGVCDVLAAKKTWGTSGPMDVGPSDMGPNVEVFTVGNENGYATVRVEQFFAVSAVLNGEGQ